jgi:hypothetical protein
LKLSIEGKERQFVAYTSLVYLIIRKLNSEGQTDEGREHSKKVGNYKWSKIKE